MLFANGPLAELYHSLTNSMLVFSSVYSLTHNSKWLFFFNWIAWWGLNVIALRSFPTYSSFVACIFMKNRHRKMISHVEIFNLCTYSTTYLYCKWEIKFISSLLIYMKLSSTLKIQSYLFLLLVHISFDIQSLKYYNSIKCDAVWCKSSSFNEWLYILLTLTVSNFFLLPSHAYNM